LQKKIHRANASLVKYIITMSSMLGFIAGKSFNPKFRKNPSLSHPKTSSDGRVERYSLPKREIETRPQRYFKNKTTNFVKEIEKSQSIQAP